jgi:putative inorganic carbon (hco3(-)) transporter
VNQPVAMLPVERSWPWLGSRHAYVALLAVIAVVATAAATVRSPQLGCAIALVVMVVSMSAASPAAGVAALTLTWLMAPGIRRVLGLEVGYLPEDPLSVAPFVATLAVAAMAAWRERPPRTVFAVPAVVAGGLLFGVPAGLADANAAAFSLMAYLSALSAFLVGWSDGRLPMERWTMLRTLWLAAPPLALYALAQYFLGPPVWDQTWLEVVEFSSIGAPEADRIRAFASLNAPGTLGVVLALAILVNAGRPEPVRILSPAVAVVAAGLAVTYVRSAWIALVVATLVLLLASRGRAAPQVGRLAIILALAVLALSASGSTFTAFIGRIETLADLGQDDSAEARAAVPAIVLPALVDEPLGFGLGTAGEATRLSPRGGLAAPDNGYLAMAFQLGLVGASFVLAGLLTAMAIALRRLWAARDPDRALVAAFFAFFLVALLAGDQFYGLGGVILWYVVGASVGRRRS